ncbi:dTMP kinase [Nakamurella sp. A5-74]|uniref:Thymidylate kinase n=1 Tax=Nakamurella sp. A5-74 TaxID=3158264 RepID=A0AAU8DKL2_9ACTN
MSAHRGRLVVIEGLDGSGKNTLTRSLVARAERAGARVATLDFPRYGRSIHADLVRDMLYGRLGDLSHSVHGGALLFALDRRDALPDIESALADNDLLVLDRYISANAAYASARLGGPAGDAGTAMPKWVRELEVDRFGLPVPDLQLLLDTDADESARRAAQRAGGDATRELDDFERDGDLQVRTGQMYARLAAGCYLSPWTVLRSGPDGVDEVSERDLLG